MALQPGVGLGLLYNTPPSLSIPPFVYSHLSKVRGHVIQPSHFWSSSSSCCIQLSVHLFWNCGVLHSFYMTKPSCSLAFYKHCKYSEYRSVESCVFLGYYAASSGNSLSTFRDNLSVPRPLKMGSIGCPNRWQGIGQIG